MGNELHAVAEFASTAEKLGIIGLLVVFALYLIWEKRQTKKDTLELLNTNTKLLNDIKIQMQTSNEIFKQNQAMVERVYSLLTDDIKYIREKTNEIYYVKKYKSSDEN